MPVHGSAEAETAAAGFGGDEGGAGGGAVSAVEATMDGVGVEVAAAEAAMGSNGNEGGG